MAETPDNFTEAACVLARRLRALADDVERTTTQFGQASRVGSFRPATHAAGYMLGSIAGLLRDHAPNLIARASEADEALIEHSLDVDRLAQIIRRVDQEQDAVMAGPDVLAQAIHNELTKED